MFYQPRQVNHLNVRCGAINGLEWERAPWGLVPSDVRIERFPCVLGRTPYLTQQAMDRLPRVTDAAILALF